MKDKRKLWFSIAGLLAGLSLILAACGPTETVSTSPLSTPPASDAPEMAMPDEAQEMVELVKQDLSERLDLGRNQIEIASLEKVEWPDTSLGCPEPGQAYAQVITPGYEITLQAEGQRYSYHTGGDRFVLCEDEDAAPPVEDRDKEDMDEGTLTEKEQELVEQAMVDLSERLDATPQEITLLSVDAVQWRDSSMGCPEPGGNYLMVITPGYLIKLKAEGQVYEYHGNEEQVFYCENPQAPVGEEKDEESVMERLVAKAKADLSQRLNVKDAQIEVVEVRAVQWRDASLGCPKGGKMYAQVITPGYQIILSVEGQEYDYHANMQDAFLCQK